MHMPLRDREQNIGREDRFVRACVALSLLLLSGFSLLASDSVEPIAIGFTLGFAYFCLTAAVAWDPLYARLGVDTRTQVPHAVDALIDADPFARDERHGAPGPASRPIAVDADPAPAATPAYVSVVDLTDAPDREAAARPPAGAHPTGGA